MTRIAARTSSALVALCALALPSEAQTRTYTTDADFDEGTLVNVNHDAPNNDQLQLGAEMEGVSLLSVACGGTGTVVRIDTRTGEVLGEYLTSPAGYERDPSRATVDLLGNTWVGNRLEDGDATGSFGSVMKIGTIFGGTRVNADGTPNPNGEYLAPPYEYNTCIDRDGDGLIRTSRGLGDVLAWPKGTDGDGGADARVEDALDECVMIFQRTNPTRVRHLSIDGDNNLWAGGYPSFPTSFDQLDGETGAFLQNLAAVPPGCGGYAGLVDPAGTLWSTSELEGQVLRWDGVNPATCIDVQNNVRGIAVATSGELLASGGTQLARLAADGSGATLMNVRGASQLHGITVHTGDGSIWLASSGNDRVLRLDADGNLVATIDVDFGGNQGDQPRGLSMDRAGMIWVANQGSDDVMRIDPATNSVDLRVPLSAGARPYNPSDMTGEAVLGSLLNEGSWDVVTDGVELGTPWSSASWSAQTAGGSTLTVEGRAADDEADLDGQPWQALTNGGSFALSGRFLQTRVNFLRGTASPILFDLTVGAGAPDCVNPNRRNAGSLLLFPEFDNVTGSSTILTVTNSGHSTGGSIDVEFVYIDGDSCEEFNRTETLTPNDTLTLLTRFHNPNQERGYCYAFAKDTETGEPIVANSLTGSLLVISSGICKDEGSNGTTFETEYMINAVAFRGIGAEGSPTDLDADGIRDLDDQEYEGAPDQILIPRFLGQGIEDCVGEGCVGGPSYNSALVLVGLSGGARFSTTLDFLIYNDNEEIFSSEFTFECWDKVDLLDITNLFSREYLQNFTNDDPNEVLGSNTLESGWMRIDGAVASSASTDIDDPAFYAVLIERISGLAGADLPFEECSQTNGALLPRTLSGE